MKKILVITIIVLIAALAGWITFSRTPGKATFTIETEKMKDDAKSVIEKGKDLGEELLDKGRSTNTTTDSESSEPNT